MQCNKCNSMRLIKAGTERRPSGLKQRYKCQECGHIQIDMHSIAEITEAD